MELKIMVTTRKKTTSRSNSKSKSNGKSNSKSTKAMTPEALRDRILSGIERKYKLRLATREERIATKVGHAIREKLGKDIQSKVKSFDWKEWNNKTFPTLFGTPDDLKYPVEVVAEAAALIYDSINNDSLDGAIQDLVEFNAASLKRRNELAKQEEDEDLADLDDEEEMEIEDLLDDEDEDEEEFEDDEDEFELDDDEDFEDEFEDDDD